LAFLHAILDFRLSLDGLLLGGRNLNQTHLKVALESLVVSWAFSSLVSQRVALALEKESQNSLLLFLILYELLLLAFTQFAFHLKLVYQNVSMKV